MVNLGAQELPCVGQLASCSFIIFLYFYVYPAIFKMKPIFLIDFDVF